MAPAGSEAATFTPNTTDDELNNDGDCSLREAIQAANVAPPVDNCTGTNDPGDTIVLQNNTTYTRTLVGAAEDSNATGDFDVFLEPLTIQLSAPGNSPATIAGNGTASIDRNIDLFASAGSLTITGVRLTQGAVDPGTGGGIFVAAGASLSLTASTVDNNSAGTSGGGILGAGNVNLKNVTLSNNSTVGDGGALDLLGNGLATLNNVTVASNTADSDQNDAGDGGGFHDNSTADINIRNTIVGNNVDSSPTVGLQAPDCSGSPFSNNWNLVENTANCAYTPAANDITGQDPALSGLGPSDSHFVHALMTTSPARDAGNDTFAVGTGGASCEAVDQRNRARSGALTGFGGQARCDIGAFELQTITAAPAITDTDPDSPSPTNTTPQVKGSAGTTDPSIVNVEVFTQSNCQGAAVGSGSRAVFIVGGIPAGVPANQTTQLSARGLSGDGVPGPCSADFPYTHDDIALAPIITSTNPASGSNANSPLVIGTAESGAMVSIFRSGECPAGTPLATGPASQFTTTGLQISVTDNSTTALVARQVDAAGNTSPCSTPAFNYAELTPAAPVLKKKKKCKKKKRSAAAAKKKCKKKKK